MQTKKNYVQQAIITAAEAEFLAHGFKGSSMRRMAAAAGTGMSNFYNYFRSKEDLFAFIVEERVLAIRALFKRIQDEDIGVVFKDIRDYRTLLYNLRRWASRFDILYNRETLLVLTSGKDTMFESVRDEITDGLFGAVLRLTSWDMSVKIPEQFPLRFFISKLIDDMLFTANEYKGNPKIKDILRNQLVTAAAGYYAMMN